MKITSATHAVRYVDLKNVVSPLYVLLALLFTCSPSWSATISWLDITGGNYNDPLNWSTSTLPSSTDDALFALAQSTAYTVNLTADTTSFRLIINTDKVDFDLGGNTYNTIQAVSIGRLAGNNGLLTVSNGTFDVGGQLIVAEYGTGTLVLDNNVTVNSGDGNVGFVGGSNGTVLLSGSGSSWHNSGTLYSGRRGTGNINVSNGADLTSVSSTLGLTSGNGRITIDGVGSTWFNSGSVYIGGSSTAAGGTGVVDVQNNGVVDVGGTVKLWSGGTLNLDGGAITTGSFDGSLGTFNFTDGTLTVDGGTYDGGTADLIVDSTGAGDNPTLVLSNGASADFSSDDAVIGSSGVGTLNIDSGGLLTSRFGYLGENTGSDGMATVSGTDSTWDSSSLLYVGNRGTGTLNIDSGGSVITDSGALGRFSSGIGTATVSGAASSWDSGFSLAVGASGTGTLNINSGGLVITAKGYLGRFSGGSGTAIVSGTNSTWTNTNSLHVGGDSGGAGGTGQLSVYSGANVNVTNLLKLWGGSTVNLDGGAITAGSFDSSLGTFNFADGTLTVNGGTYVDDNISLLIGGAGAGDNPTLVLSNGASADYSAGNVFLGFFGTSGATGTLNIESGSTVESVIGFVGFDGGSATATVSGTGSNWENSNNLSVGHSGIGTVNINSGGSVSNMIGYLGINSSGDGTVTVSGTNSTWTNNDSLYIGGSSSGAAGTGVLNVGTGGKVVVTNLLKVWGAGTLNLNGGTVTLADLESEGSVNFAAGTLNFTNNLSMDTNGPLGNSFSLSSLRTLDVSGLTTLNGASTLTLDGGTFSTGSLGNNGGFTFNSGTFNLTSDNLTVGSGGLFGSTVQVGANQAFNVTNSTTVDGNGLLYVNGGKFSAGNLINNGQVAVDGLLSELGGAVSNNGLLNGDGRISAVLSNNAGGEVQVSSGDTLRFTAAGNTNSGEINLSGGTARFDQDLTNASGGVIAGRGTLVANGGLTNQGNIGLSSGITDIFGDVNNATGGAIIVSGNGTATFYDDLVHNGTEIRVSDGSNAVFFGAVSGAGSYTGTGSLFFEGDLMPGNSPGLVNIEGDMGLGLNSHTLMEIAGLARGTEYDAFNIGGDLLLGGELELSLYDLGSGLFSPELGDSFDLFMAETITGGFDLWTTAMLGGGLDWQLDFLADAIGSMDVVRLSVVTGSTVPIPPALWLFGSGLLGLVAIARNRKPGTVDSARKQQGWKFTGRFRNHLMLAKH